MLKIKYIPEFEEGEPMIVIIGKEEDYLIASKYLSDKTEASLDDPNFAIYYDSGILPRKLLHLNKRDCKNLSEMFEDFSIPAPKNRGHDYYDTKVLTPLEIELYISIREYDESIFEDQ